MRSAATAAPGNAQAHTGVSQGKRRKGAFSMDQAQKLRDLAAWYREFAERAENPAIWDARLRTAEELEKEAGYLESKYFGLLAGAPVP
jgi:hypothetical protein